MRAKVFVCVARPCATKLQDNADAARRFQEVQKAYETLRDPEKRRCAPLLGRAEARAGRKGVTWPRARR